MCSSRRRLGAQYGILLLSTMKQQQSNTAVYDYRQATARTYIILELMNRKVIATADILEVLKTPSAK